MDSMASAADDEDQNKYFVQDQSRLALNQVALKAKGIEGYLNRIPEDKRKSRLLHAMLKKRGRGALNRKFKDRWCILISS